MSDISDRLKPGPLLEKVDVGIIWRQFGPLEKVQQTDDAELYLLRAPYDVQQRDVADPQFKLVTKEGVVATFGTTGLVSLVEQIGQNGRLREILSRDPHGNFYLARSNLPVDGIPNNPNLDDGQLIPMIIDYIYKTTTKLPNDSDDWLGRLFHDWNSQQFFARFRDFRALTSDRDIIPDESDLTVHVKISEGCPRQCVFCPEGGRFSSDSMEHIIKSMERVRELQIKYHGKVLEQMEDGFINTTDLLLFATEGYRERGIDPIEVVANFRKIFPEVQKLGSFVSVKSVNYIASQYGTNRFRELWQAGFNRAYIGIETGHDEASRILGKKETFQEKYDAMRLLESNGIRVKAIVQVGTLGKGFYPVGKPMTEENFVTSEEALSRTIELMNRVQVYRTMISEFVPFEGLRIHGLYANGRIVPYDNPRDGIQKEIDMLVRGLVSFQRKRGTDRAYQQYLPENPNLIANRTPR